MLEQLSNLLYRGLNNENVRSWQIALQKLNFSPGEIDGDFGPNTERATIAFQRASGLETDGVVGPRTLEKAVSLLTLGGQTTPVTPRESEGFNGAAIAEFAEKEASLGYTWYRGSPARKYTKDFEPVFGMGRFSWCAAWVRWVYNNFDGKGGCDVPVHLKNQPYTTGLVEQWQMWSQSLGFYKDNDGVYIPKPGNAVMFDWDQNSIHQADRDWEDHIGIHLRTISPGKYLCAEGNTGNKSAIKVRYAINIQGWTEFPEGWKAN